MKATILAVKVASIFKSRRRLARPLGLNRGRVLGMDERLATSHPVLHLPQAPRLTSSRTRILRTFIHVEIFIIKVRVFFAMLRTLLTVRQLFHKCWHSRRLVCKPNVRLPPCLHTFICAPSDGNGVLDA